MSTILGVLVLAFINSYMVLVFFKTIFLVLVVGIFHALVLLPIILHDTAPLTDRLTRYLKERQRRSLNGESVEEVIDSKKIEANATAESQKELQKRMITLIKVG